MGLFSKRSPAPRFGKCCDDLKAAIQQPENSMFLIESNGVLFLSVWYVTTPEGTGWFDQAVLFCPFCGSQLQSREEIAAKSADA